MPAKRGRPKGGKNQPKRALIALLNERFPKYNAVLEMAAMANDQENDQAFRFKAHAEVAQYQESKRKAVEVTGEGGGPVVVALDKLDLKACI